MNRLIKFRAWDFEKNIMLDKHDKINGMLNERCFMFPPSFETVNTKFAWMQFTGLHDVNGKEIYEGDILSLRSQFNGNWSINGAAVIFSYEYVGGWVLAGRDNENLNIGTRQNHVEVIGNIYENPELLTL